MPTTQTTNAGPAGLLWAAPVEVPSSSWPFPVRGDIGTLPWGRLRRVIEYIQQNLDKDLPLAELSALVHMSPYHFARLFKCSTGAPPHQFVVRQRIVRACECLATQGLSIAQISRRVGFRTPSHFTTVFRRITGVTPSGYRAGYVREAGPAGKKREMGLSSEELESAAHLRAGRGREGHSAEPRSLTIESQRFPQGPDSSEGHSRPRAASRGVVIHSAWAPPATPEKGV